jgi:isoleucyl-tRNA synthetase
MPVWESEDGDRIVVGSIKELEDLSGQRVVNLHRPYIDEITIEKNGKTYKRRHEVLDSWMDAGSMPFAQIHYPFENQERFEKNYPGDYVSEYIAQVRAWFYVLHVMSTCLFETASFKNVITTGVMAGHDGRKMSKTFKNYTDPKKVLEDIGGDALRLYLMNSPLMAGENTNFDEKELKTKLRNVLNPLWNSAKFFLIYASEHNFTPSDNVKSKNYLDKWIIGRMNQTLLEISSNIEKYLVPPAVQSAEDFVDDLSRWYVRRSRERISAGDPEALNTLYKVLSNFVMGAAPILPFLTEKIYQELILGKVDDSEESVHLMMYPEHDSKLVDDSKELFEKMATTREIVSAALAIRTENKMKVRQPLSKVVLSNSLKNKVFEELITDEVNVKKVEYSDEKLSLPKFEAKEYDIYLDIHLDEGLKLEGMARDFVRSVQDKRKKEGLSVADKIVLTYPTNDTTDKMFDQFSDYIKEKTQTTELIQGKDIKIEVVDK